MPFCCDPAVGHPLTGLAILALCRQRCQPLTQAAIITATTTPPVDQCQLTIIISLPQLSASGSPSCLFNAMTLSPPWANCWRRSTRGHRSYFNLPHSVVSGTLRSFGSMGLMTQIATHLVWVITKIKAGDGHAPPQIWLLREHSKE